MSKTKMCIHMRALRLALRFGCNSHGSSFCSCMTTVGSQHTMSETGTELLRKAWTEGGRPGELAAWSQAKVWALREVWRSDGKKEYSVLTSIPIHSIPIHVKQRSTQRSHSTMSEAEGLTRLGQIFAAAGR